MIFQKPIPRPYGPDVKAKLDASIDKRPGKQELAPLQQDQPCDFLNGPKPDPADSIVTGWYNRPVKPPLHLTQQECDDFVTIRDMLLGIAGYTVFFSPNCINDVSLPTLLKHGQLYYGECAGGTTMKIKTRPLLNNGYMETFLEDNPYCQVFEGYELSRHGHWSIPSIYPVPVIVDDNGGIIFVKSHTDAAAYFGVIHPHGTPFEDTSAKN